MCGQTNQFIFVGTNPTNCIQSSLPSSICLDVLLVLALKGMKSVERWEGRARRT